MWWYALCECECKSRKEKQCKHQVMLPYVKMRMRMQMQTWMWKQMQKQIWMRMACRYKCKWNLSFSSRSNDYHNKHTSVATLQILNIFPFLFFRKLAFFSNDCWGEWHKSSIWEIVLHSNGYPGFNVYFCCVWFYFGGRWSLFIWPFIHNICLT